MLLLKQHSVFSRQLISRQAIFQSCMLKANGFLASIGAVIYTDFGPLCKFLESILRLPSPPGEGLLRIDAERYL